MLLKHRVAKILRKLATRLDGREFVSDRWQNTSVTAMNKYIGQTERYILDLEKYVTPGLLDLLRKAHGRFDTKPLAQAGAWKNDKTVECTMKCEYIMHMTGGHHRTDCPAYENEDVS